MKYPVIRCFQREKVWKKGGKREKVWKERESMERNLGNNYQYFQVGRETINV